MKTPEIDLPEGFHAHFGDDPEQVALDLAKAVAGFLRERLAEAPRASLVVSGGSTPLPFFRALSRADLDWRRVDLLLADERWVPEDDPASNTRLVRENLLQGHASDAHFLSLKQPGATPLEGLEAVKEELSCLTLPLDVVILGMGNDGHTASLFPDAPELPRAMDPDCPDLVAAATPPSQPHQRISLTRPPLRDARFTALHLKGGDKLETLRRALVTPDDVMSMPVRGFLKPGLNVFWSP
ncbi:6-phosphogluconolactonase [Marinobacter sp. M216]|uniref:6-phosphogluconolactonase n=1 Tax=Marinobacter albus TaxID=3030833 RepID=A0ABT7HBY0_9GAMM|nr:MULTISPECIES: 6-phosphogluconolactonase [unclassified Marinobacter]MBW7470227.1 6-phosphogluconolactonase [Marinobacter sp. F4218]MDK9557509.1 6-phosphogluconolactonase [Marinobacter sp. M216]